MKGSPSQVVTHPKIPAILEKTKMKVKLSLRPDVWSRTSPVTEAMAGPVVQYKVDGWPSDEVLLIRNHAEGPKAVWRILRCGGSGREPWKGDYNTAEEALAFLQDEVDSAVV
jgi:hypothetical protein